MEDFLNTLVKLPIATKLGALAALVVAVTAVNVFVWPNVSDIVTQTERQQQQLRRLQDDLSKKQAIANSLNEYRRKMEVLEQQLKEALTEMPEEVKMDDLLTQLEELAKKAGLQLSSLTPQNEGTGEGGFYYSIPIKMQVEGGYNEIAVFLDSVSKLKRIVNVNNITLASPKTEADKVVLKAEYLATTFRFAGNKADKGKQARR